MTQHNYDYTDLSTLGAVRFGIGEERGITPFNLLTMATTRKVQKHIFTAYLLSNGHTVYCEMQFGQGHIGPRSIIHKDEWERKYPWRKVNILWLPIDPVIVRHKFENEIKLHNTVEYAERQLLYNLAQEFTGEPAPTDDSDLTCCEHGGIQAVFMSPFWDVRTKERPNMDSTNPGFLMDRLRELFEIYKRENPTCKMIYTS